MDKATGKFTATQKGTFMFFFSAYALNDARCDFVKGNRTIDTFGKHHTSNSTINQSITGSLIVELDANEEIHVMFDVWSTHFALEDLKDGYLYTENDKDQRRIIFSGFQLGGPQ